MLDSYALLTSNFVIRTGRIAGFDDGMILVESEEWEFLLPCYILRTTPYPPPEFDYGDPVIFISDGYEKGYILGLTEVYTPSSHINESGNPVRIEFPSEETDVKVDGKRLIIEAQEEIRIKCGQGMIMMNKEGKIVIRGTHLLTRSSGANKIKGATVQIN